MIKRLVMSILAVTVLAGSANASEYKLQNPEQVFPRKEFQECQSQPSPGLKGKCFMNLKPVEERLDDLCGGSYFLRSFKIDPLSPEPIEVSLYCDLDEYLSANWDFEKGAVDYLQEYSSYFQQLEQMYDLPDGTLGAISTREHISPFQKNGKRTLNETLVGSFALTESEAMNYGLTVDPELVKKVSDLNYEIEDAQQKKSALIEINDEDLEMLLELRPDLAKVVSSNNDKKSALLQYFDQKAQQKLDELNNLDYGADDRFNTERVAGAIAEDYIEEDEVAGVHQCIQGSDIIGGVEKEYDLPPGSLADMVLQDGRSVSTMPVIGVGPFGLTEEQARTIGIDPNERYDPVTTAKAIAAHLSGTYAHSGDIQYSLKTFLGENAPDGERVKRVGKLLYDTRMCEE